MLLAFKSVKAHPGATMGALAALAVSSYFIVSGLGHLSASPPGTLRAADDKPRPSSPSQGEAEPLPAADAIAVAKAVLERNIFDSTTGGIVWVDPELETTVPEAEEGEAGDDEEGE